MVGERRQYIGDGCYVEASPGGMIKLTTSDGIRDTNTVYLEPVVYRELVRFARDTMGWKVNA